jgi:hypothetical protein
LDLAPEYCFDRDTVFEGHEGMHAVDYSAGQAINQAVPLPLSRAFNSVPG